MNDIRSEQSPPNWRRKRHLAVGVLASSFLAFAVVSAVSAAGPPQPDFAWPYGKVQQDGANITPGVQRVIALVNGKACGEGMTLVAQAGPGVPAGDVGKTVYVVDVLADGTSPGQRVGCGHPGDIISLYFPGFAPAGGATNHIPGGKPTARRRPRHGAGVPPAGADARE